MLDSLSELVICSGNRANVTRAVDHAVVLDGLGELGPWSWGGLGIDTFYSRGHGCSSIGFRVVDDYYGLTFVLMQEASIIKNAGWV